MIEFIFVSLKVLGSIAVFQALLIAFFLLIQKKGNKINRIILAILLINFILFLGGSYLLLFKNRWNHIYYAHLANLTVFLAPPLLYLYYRSLLDNAFKFTVSDFFHCVPFIAIFSFMFYTIVFKYNHGFVFTPYGVAILFLLFTQSLVYLMLILKQRRSYTPMNRKNDKAKWFGYIFMSILAIFSLKLIIFILWNVFGLVDICIFFTGVFLILSFVIINMMILFGLSNPDLLIQYFKYQHSTIDESYKSRCYTEIQSLLIHKKIYLDSLLNLKRMARKLTISEKQLSQIINECAGQNFNDYINQYRIAEARELLRSDDYKNVLSVAYEVGFNSKSTFNTAFKKFTNMTPTQYKQVVI